MTASLFNNQNGNFANVVDGFVYPQFIGYAMRAPTTHDIYNPGTRWQDNSVSPPVQWYTTGAGIWNELPNSSFGVSSVTGTANQILANPTVGAVVLSLIGPYTPATYTAHGVLIGEGTSSIVATAAGTAGQVLTSGGPAADPTWTTATFPATVAQGALLVGTAANVIGSLADVAVGQVLMSGGVGVVPAYSASPSVTGSVTAGTSITATLGNITATNGNIVRGTAGNKDVYTSVASTSAAGANSAGTVALAGGTVTVATTAVTASSQIRLYRQGIGATGAAALGYITLGTVTPATSFVINSVQAADATALQASDVSVIGWEIVN